MRKLWRGHWQRKLSALFLLVFFAVYFVFPVYWIAASSLKAEAQMFAFPPAWLFKPTVVHYREFLIEAGNLCSLKNSLIVALLNTFLSMLLGMTAAYSLSRFRFRGRGLFQGFALFLRMIPPIAIALPLFLLVRKAGLYDTHLALTLGTMVFTLPFSIWMMKGFFDGLPREIEESALIDGCTYLGVIVRVVVPLSVTSMLVTSVFCWFYTWNEFLYPLVLTESKAKTVTVIINEFLLPTGEIRWGQMFASGTTVMFPAIAFGLLVRRYFIRGITLGSVRE